MTKVSIIVPCYNQAQYLPEALQSVLDQTYSNWECIIVNDGSPDDTDKVAQEWLRKDPRFKYIYKENGGLSSARNAGIEIAEGEFMQFLDSDDILVSNKLELSLTNIIRENALIVVSNFRMFTNDCDESTEPFCVLKAEYLNYENILLNWDIQFSIPIHCGFFKKSFFDVFRFPIELKAKEDWMMWISIFENNPKSIFIDEVLVGYRLHQASMTKDKKIMETNYFASLIYLKNRLKDSDFEKLLTKKISFLNDKIIYNELKFQNIKNSNSYKLGFKIRDLSDKIGILDLFKLIVKKYK
ncbi:hypothetical protein SAMN05444396_104147 [Flavobacterium segetis]|uniref:Glycosyltransferase 2-like domain-containing protein n=1 Tax=Flavobacterium segetis TaxID=271157 RepID=A0A1M5GTN7_9FLAO|nr:glycosyltransferase family 2 protein [Flavobacterium segetis]SHG07037.1 hypothetical protein SAMN05444396_104147 [Flavobacterium segetis]